MKLNELSSKVKRGPLENKSRKAHATAIVNTLKKLNHDKYNPIFHEIRKVLKLENLNMEFLAIIGDGGDYKIELHSLINNIADAKISITQLMQLRKKVEREIQK